MVVKEKEREGERSGEKEGVREKWEREIVRESRERKIKRQHNNNSQDCRVVWEGLLVRKKKEEREG